MAFDTLGNFEQRETQEDLKNAEIAEVTEATKKEAKELKQDVETQQKPRPVETLPSGNIRVPYDRKGEKWNFDIDGRENMVIVRHQKYIPELGKVGWVVEEHMPINTSSPDELEKSMKRILDTYIGKERAPIPQKLDTARDLLIQNLEPYAEKDFERDEEENMLSYVYILGNKGAGISLQKIDQSVLITIGVHNDFGPGSNQVKRIVPINHIDKIPNIIHGHFAEGVDLTTYFDITTDDNYVPNDDLLKKIKQKAQAATNIIRRSIEK